MKSFDCLVATAVSCCTAICMAGVSGSALADKTSGKPTTLINRGTGPNAVSQDFGNVAVLVDNGLIVSPRNLFDLNGIRIRFQPSGAGYSASSSTGTLDADV